MRFITVEIIYYLFMHLCICNYSAQFVCAKGRKCLRITLPVYKFIICYNYIYMNLLFILNILYSVFPLHCFRASFK